MVRRYSFLLVLPLLAGCSVADLATAERYSRGLVIVLPGIEGRSAYNVNVARGLAAGGVPSAIEIYDWNAPVPFAPVLNLADLERNRSQGARLARRIRQYQMDYPGRSVFLFGHSAGAGIAILALEALPPERSVTAAVLLAPAVGPHHNLKRALQHTDVGIFNFYSPNDIFFLKLATGVLGTVDRELGSAAGAVGFKPPADSAGRTLYARRLFQIKWTSQMARYGNNGGHMGCTDPRFVREYLAPLVIQQQRGEWPRGRWAGLIKQSPPDKGPT